MRAPLYIGVTGFMTPQEVRAGLRVIDRAPRDRKLMVGVLMSSKTLTGVINKWPGRYPKIDRIREIFQTDPVAVNLIHYHTEVKETLCDQLLSIDRVFGLNLHGFQLNVAWPEVTELEKFQRATFGKFRLVLQVGERAMEKVEHSPQKLADMIARYAGSSKIVDDILIDPSGGKGQPFHVGKAHAFLREIKSRGFDVNLGIAGGLGPDRLSNLEPLLDEFPDLNIDAEGQLRDEESDDLDVEKMTTYLEQAQLLMHRSKL